MNEQYFKSKLKEQNIDKRDEKHIENYKSLANFLENSILESTESENPKSKLVSTCIKAIRYLDTLVNSYEVTSAAAAGYNQAVAEMANELVQTNETVTTDENIGEDAEAKKN